MDKALFEERLQLGHDKEYYVKDILNLCGVKTEFNNVEDKYDIDLYLRDHDIYMDVKYLESSFDATSFHDELTADKCLIISKVHVKRYELKREDTGKDTWVAFLINFEEQGIFDLKFIRTEYILKLIQDEKAIVRPIMVNGDKKMIINLNKNDCIDMTDFLNYLKNIVNK